MASSLDCLQPGFDPSKLKKDRLRGILLEYEILFKADDKKPELIKLFAEQLAPHAIEILDEKAKVKRSSKGIINASTKNELRSSAPRDREGLIKSRNKSRHTAKTRTTEWSEILSRSFESRKTENATKDDKDLVFANKDKHRPIPLFPKAKTSVNNLQIALMDEIIALLENYNREIQKVLYDDETN